MIERHVFVPALGAGELGLDPVEVGTSVHLVCAVGYGCAGGGMVVWRAEGGGHKV